MIKELVLKNRSYRRFYQDVPLTIEILRSLVELARLSPSGRNVQPLKFFLSNELEKNDVIFKHLSWAGYLKDWPGPSIGEHPAAYILILGDKTITDDFGVNHGIAAQSILLGAVEMGLGGCIVGSVQRPELQAALSIPTHLEILLAVALGKPKEQVVIEPLGEDGDIRYWRDAQEIHHVPKRSLDELII